MKKYIEFSRGEVMVEEIADKYKKIILNEVEKLSLPKEHPFLAYPNTPESRNLDIYIFLNMMMGEQCDIPKKLLQKCNGLDNGKYSHLKFLEGLDEALILYYILIVNLENVSSVIYEPSEIMKNNKTLEYSCVFERPIRCLVNIEVKTMRCDPFVKEDNLNIRSVSDGSILIKRLINDDAEYDTLLRKHPEAIELKSSTYYSAFKQNIKRIIAKYEGGKNIQCPMLNIGFICIHFSTSMEEFYTYMFHEEKGIYKNLDWGNLDALVLFLVDARDDVILQNVYEMGYVVTMLKTDTLINRKFMEIMRLDNYILQGNEVNDDIHEVAQKGAKLFKVLKREGFLNILPFEATEEDIKNYLEYLKSEKIRYDKN